MARRLLSLLAAFAVAGVLLGADQASKRWAEDELRARGPRELLGGTLILRHGTNRGIAFGLWKDHLHPRKRLWLTMYSAVCTAALAGALLVRGLRRGVRRPGTTAGLTALLAGAAGNLWDRASRGWVVDFIDVGVGQLRWPAFNLADVYLSVGLVLCLVSLLRTAAVAERVLR